jgi:hypothetical protein
MVITNRRSKSVLIKKLTKYFKKKISSETKDIKVQMLNFINTSLTRNKFVWSFLFFFNKNEKQNVLIALKNVF